MYDIKNDEFIGRKIKEKRRELGITQDILAEKIGVTYQQIQRYENGSNRLNVEKLQRIAVILDVPMVYFFSDLDNNRYHVRDNISQDYSNLNSKKNKAREDEKIVNHIKKIRNKRYKKLFIEMIKLILKAEYNEGK